MKRTRMVKVKGKGHGSCFERLLREWYLRESFSDVQFIWSEEDSDDRESILKIAANRR